MGSIITAEKIHKTYFVKKTEVSVLKGASISVKSGEAVAIIGMSGAGKSTLMHVLGGLDKPDEGRVTVDDQDLYQVTEKQRSRIRSSRIGFVFQSYHLLPEMTVLENALLPSMTRAGFSGTAAEARQRASDLLKSVGLAQRMDHMPMELSGGEQQRVALARALMNDPALILADEPTGNLDATTGGQVLELLFEMTRKKGHTLVIVTHNEQVAKACDRMFVLAKGVLTEK